MKKYILIAFTFILLFCQNLYSGNEFALKKMDSWIIIDGTKTNINLSLSDEMYNYSRLGYILNLHFDDNTRTFYHQSTPNAKVNFSELCDTLVSRIKRKGNKYAIIFNIDNHNIEHFNNEILKLKEKISFSTTRASNQALSQILELDSLVLFARNNNCELNASVHYLQTYFDSHNILDTKKNKVFAPTSAQASIIYGIFDNNKTIEIDGVNEQRHFWQSKYIKNWTETGLQPLFIVAESQTNYARQITIIADTPKETNCTVGKVTLNGVPLNYFYWNGSKPSFSYGYFNYPLTNNKVFKPYKAGYEFTPKEIAIELNQKNVTLNFKAQPININEGLQVKLVFNDSLIYNEVNETTLFAKKSEIIASRSRGSVLKINKGGYVPVGTALEYGIRDHSFSIAFWYKIEKQPIHRYTLLGTNTRVLRQGLHIQLINNSPCFGFFINDLKSAHSINPLKWSHLTFTYDHTIKEKRIYIDGKLMDSKLESSSFIGSDTIFIGKCIGRKLKAPFLMDNFVLWNRSINEDEVKTLLSENSMLAYVNTKRFNHYYWLLLAPCLAVALLLLKNRKRPIAAKKILKETKNHKNAIVLYGNFSVFDQHGNNIVPNMSPLTKELFLKLLTYYLQGGQGVSSKELNELFWEGLPPSKARNSRNVALVRLRKYISEVKGLRIEYIANRHCVVANNHLFIDCQKAEEHNALLNMQDVLAYYNLVKHGKFLEDMDYHWLDETKETYNSKNTVLFANALNDSGLITSDDLREEICKYLLKIDDLNEEALMQLLLLYKKQGKSNLMSQFFNEFTALYQKTYASDFKYSMPEFLALTKN